MGDEQPYGLAAYANAPQMVTIGWNHSGDGVYYFVLEQESPFTY